MSSEGLAEPGDAQKKPALLRRVVWILLLALTSTVVTLLGLFAAVGTFLTWASLPSSRGGSFVREHRLLALAAIFSTVGLVRFIVERAMPGIVEGGTRATEQRAVSMLREVLFAEDTARRAAKLDPDRDGIGSALLLGEMTGENGVRGQARLEPPLLERYERSVETPIGPAVPLGGYLLIVCLPRPDGSFSARPGEAFDEERAERRFLAYAWPGGLAPLLSHAYALDEHEHIWVAKSKPNTLRSGFEAPPRCDEARDGQNGWKPWRGKEPRPSLPGDR